MANSGTSTHANNLGAQDTLTRDSISHARNPHIAQTYAEAIQGSAINPEANPIPRVTGVLDAETVGSNSSIVEQRANRGTENGNMMNNKHNWTLVRKKGWRAVSLEDMRSRNSFRAEVPRDLLSEEQNRARAAIEMRNAQISPEDEPETTSSSEEEVSPPKKNKRKAVDRKVQDESLEPRVDRDYETAAQVATENLIDRLRDNANPDINLEAQRNALENFNTARNNGIQINAVHTGEAGGSGSNNWDDAVLHPGVLIENSTNLPNEEVHRHRRDRRRSKSKRRHSKSKGKHCENSKSRNKQRKAQGLHNPMSSRYERKLEDAIRGRSRAPENRYASEVAQPINQLPENSLLAKNLGMRNPETEKSNKRKRASKKGRGHESSSDLRLSSSSSGSSDDNDSYSSEGSSDSLGSSNDPGYTSSSGETSSSSSSFSSSDESYKQCQKKDKQKAYHRKTSKERRRNKRTIKPIPPPTYDGTPDAERFQNWVMRMIQYLEEGYVPEEEQVMLASNFLRGKALSFFLQKVSRNHLKWQMLDLAKGIFNFCFPIDYRSQQRNKLNNCRQGNRSVIEYAYKYEMLNNLIGTASECKMVIKFWDSLNVKIRRELHHEKKNKEIHTYEEILETAELIKMAELEFSVPTYNERPMRNPHQLSSLNRQNGNQNQYQNNLSNNSCHGNGGNSGGSGSYGRPSQGSQNQRRFDNWDQ
ncbi:hypothetical protein PQX77_002683 [Marasmius sp. AFHP31]|nr:hypothetical protein PQX77_002683 [Marasmius sp. AFHP31]